MSPSFMVGGPFCGLPAPRTAAAFYESPQGIYEYEGGAYLFRGTTMTRCPGCCAYVRLPATEDCPLCGHSLAAAPETA